MTEPNIPLPSDIDLYLNQKFKELGSQAMSKIRIYLDTNFWVLLRKQITKQQTSPTIQALLTELRDGVESGALICTFSGHTLSEIMKHVDSDTQATTAQLMDELSQGFCLANQDRLLNNEIAHWMCGWMNSGKDRYSLAELAWTRPSYLLLDYIPPNIPGIAPAEQRALQMSFIDHIWSMPMTEVLAQLQSSTEPYPALDWPQSAADNVNSEIRNYDHENHSREKMYLSELWGMIDWLGDTLVERYSEAATLWNKPLPKTSHEVDQCKVALQRTIMALGRTRSISQDLPSIHIRTMLHTNIRWDKGRRFKANDFMDMEHAQTALPACNFFFTDGPNAHLIRSAKLDITYNCVTTGSPQDALRLLRVATGIKAGSI